jgi:hypothetical protein
MGKRSNFPLKDNDLYRTPVEAAWPLAKHLPARFKFIEPCAGAGDLIDHVTAFGGGCTAAFDIAPQRRDIARRDALTLTKADLGDAAFAITNPPHSKRMVPVTLQMITLLSDLLPTWLLLPWDMLANVYFAPFLARLVKVEPIGRVRWEADTPHESNDNFCWAFFLPPRKGRRPVILPHVAKAKGLMSAAEIAKRLGGRKEEKR